MGDFEILERDGWARRGRLATPHGPIETPCLLPVVHPDPTRQPVSPDQIRSRFGLGAVITSAYITYRHEELRQRAEAEGIHGLLRFDGPVMTDSGAFQQHAYGRIEVGPEEILDFQNRIGSDIATVLDVFVEPEDEETVAARGVEATTVRAEQARRRRDGLLAVPVQGGRHPALRRRSAEIASRLGDVLAFGGVVPLFEQYRYRELVATLAAARSALSPAGALHLFGTGHPMVFALGALLGVDLYDSSAYFKFARRGCLLTPEGTIPVADLREEVCRCEACACQPLTGLAARPAEERERALAEHNLRVSAEEMARVRQAIRDGTLWELAERRAGAHPALAAALEWLGAHPELFADREPESRRAFREVGAGSRNRPAIARFRDRLRRIREGPPEGRRLPRRVPLTPEFLARIPPSDVRGMPIAWWCDTPFGPVPWELTEVYPVGPALTIDEFRDGGGNRSTPASVAESLRDRLSPGDGPEDEQERVRLWTDRQVGALLRFRYGACLPVRPPAWGGERSARTGRLRTVTDPAGPLFQIGNDGIPRPTFAGARWLHAAVPAPRERVVVAAEAAEFVRAGRSLFSRFVTSADPGLVPGASALLVGPDDDLLAVGRLLLAPAEMGILRRGVAVRVTAHPRQPVPAPEVPGEEL
ncbi:MAG: tRNA guanosine(15) transglycosylase TgtA [Thermoplasmata archaeon]